MKTHEKIRQRKRAKEVADAGKTWKNYAEVWGSFGGATSPIACHLGQVCARIKHLEQDVARLEKQIEKLTRNKTT